MGRGTGADANRRLAIPDQGNVASAAGGDSSGDVAERVAGADAGSNTAQHQQEKTKGVAYD